jgi:hypothetical protein
MKIDSDIPVDPACPAAALAPAATPPALIKSAEVFHQQSVLGHQYIVLQRS